MNIKSKKSKYILGFALLIIICAITILWARAGGAGGGGGSRGSGRGGGEAVYWIILAIIHLPFPLNIIVAGLILAGLYYGYKKKNEQSILNKLPSGKTVNSAKGYNKFIKKNPDFNEEKFKDKVKTAYLKIQEAWQKQDISKVRIFLSDGVYQRFNTQFKMMKILKQKNTINKLEVKNIYIDKVESDGLYDIIHVAIHASIDDKFICELDSSLNSGGKEEFVEYWSFLKKRNVQEKDIYNSINCPNCGAALKEGMGELSKCEYCNTLLNSGEFDWVLSEITQADDYVGGNEKISSPEHLASKVTELVNANEDFSVQLVEDKASNGYLQIMTAIAMHDPSIMRRFVSEKAFNKIQARFTKEQIAFNRIYLNDVSLIGVKEDATRNILAIAIKASFQRVKISPTKKIEKIDHVVVSSSEVIMFARDKDATPSKGSLYSHNCPSCGASVSDTLDLKCPYCRSELNSPTSEWIIDDLMYIDEYRDDMSNNSSQYTYAVDPSKLDKLYAIRDFALNNLMVIIAADGVFASEEEELVNAMAKKWGYNLDKIKEMFNMAKSGKLVIKMPEKKKQREKIYTLMVKAAGIDGTISPEEQQILDTIHKQYLSDREPWEIISDNVDMM